MTRRRSTPTEQTVGHRERVGFLLARTGRGAWLRFEQALRPLGLRPRHVVILMELRDRETTTQQALLDDLRFDPGNLVELLNDLEEQGFAERQRDPADRRRHMVRITQRGRARLADAEDALGDSEEEVLASLSQRQREQLRSLLLRIA
jgi:DNA-binding MarR family transcriptional regulator